MLSLKEPKDKSALMTQDTSYRGTHGEGAERLSRALSFPQGGRRPTGNSRRDGRWVLVLASNADEFMRRYGQALRSGDKQQALSLV